MEQLYLRKPGHCINAIAVDLWGQRLASGSSCDIRVWAMYKDDVFSKLQAKLYFDLPRSHHVLRELEGLYKAQAPRYELEQPR